MTIAEGTQDTTEKPATAEAAPSTEVVKDQPATTEAAPPSPSTTEGREKQGAEAAPPKSALEAAKRVMAQEKKPVSAEPPKADTTKTAEPPKVEGEKDAKPDTAEDDANLPFKDHPRWKKMSSENRILKVAQEKNEAAIRELEPKARTHEDLSRYLTDNGLGKEDFQNMLVIGAAMRNEPEKAYQMLAPIMAQLEGQIGVRLPDDLQAKVAGGELSQEYAYELARARAGKTLAEQRAERARSEAMDIRRETEATREEQAVETVARTLDAWGEAWRSRDPDADRKWELLEPMLQKAWGEKPPRTPEEARRQADEVLTALNRSLGVFRPAPQPKGSPLPQGSATTQSTSPVPASSLEAAKAALRAGA